MPFFTRLTPNENQWRNPSGRNWKCQGNLYEAEHGFGWEEWLLKDYWDGKQICKGFIQALNGQNHHIEQIDELHLCTRICFGNEQATLFYVGNIKNIRVIPPDQRGLTQEKIQTYQQDLADVGVAWPNDGMELNSINIEFKRNDVQFVFDANNQNRTMELMPLQMFFNLFDLDNHPNIAGQVEQIQNYI
jgi:hypothetical protein